MPNNLTYEKRKTVSDRTYKKRKAKKRRHKNGVFFYGVILTLLVTAVTIASLTVFFNINEIIVNGNSSYTSEDIVIASGIKAGQNMFRINKFKIQEEIEQKLPYISRVNISRKLPTTLIINVTPAQEYAFIKLGTGYIVIDENFKSLNQLSALEEGKLEIKNTTLKEYTPGNEVVFEKEDKKELIKEITEAFEAAQILDKISYIDVEKSYDIVIGYENRIDCKLGNTDKLEIKIMMIKNVIAANPVTDKAVIDVTNPDRTYYRKKL